MMNEKNEKGGFGPLSFSWGRPTNYILTIWFVDNESIGLVCGREDGFTY
jgi:hypothetical protein